MLTKNDFFKYELKKKTINVPAFNGEVTIRELTFGQRNDIHKRSITSTLRPSGSRAEAKADATLFSVWTIIYGVLDSEGNQMFTEEDYDKLANISPCDVLDNLSNEIWTISGSNETVEKNDNGE